MPMLAEAGHTDRFRIAGGTTLLAIIGDPIAQARAPLMMNIRLSEVGRDAVMVGCHVAPAGLHDAVLGLRAVQNFRGAIVTMPHKAAILPLLDEVMPLGRQIGACNVVRRSATGRLTGTMLDGEGFVSGLRGIGYDVTGKRVLLLGSGGAAAAIAFAVAAHGAASLQILNRTTSKAAELAARVRASYPGVEVNHSSSHSTAVDIVINATPVGMRPTDPLPFPAEQLRPGMLVADIVVQPEVTRLLEIAASRGCQVHMGRPMLAAQLDMMIDFIFENDD